jgi:hypothetical protein
MGIDIPTPFPRIPYDEAMERYGSDKPDTRFGFELKKLNHLVENCDFKVFTDALAAGGDVRGICIDGGSDKFSRKDIDKLTLSVKDYGAKGMNVASLVVSIFAIVLFIAYWILVAFMAVLYIALILMIMETNTEYAEPIYAMMMR